MIQVAPFEDMRNAERHREEIRRDTLDGGILWTLELPAFPEERRRRVEERHPRHGGFPREERSKERRNPAVPDARQKHSASAQLLLCERNRAQVVHHPFAHQTPPEPQQRPAELMLFDPDVLDLLNVTALPATPWIENQKRHVFAARLLKFRKFFQFAFSFRRGLFRLPAENPVGEASRAAFLFDEQPQYTPEKRGRFDTDDFHACLLSLDE